MRRPVATEVALQTKIRLGHRRRMRQAGISLWLGGVPGPAGAGPCLGTAQERHKEQHKEWHKERLPGLWLRLAARGCAGLCLAVPIGCAALRLALLVSNLLKACPVCRESSDAPGIPETNGPGRLDQ